MRSNKSQGSEANDVARLIGDGFLTDERAREIGDIYPHASGSVARWIEESAKAGDWHRLLRFANFGAALRAPGLDRALTDILASNPDDLNKEDLVEILGEIGAAESASVIFHVIEDSLGPDAPAYWLSQKAILALADLGTEESRQFLLSMTSDNWPKPIRWHAAVALNIEDELGFDEEAMLGY